MTSPQTDPKRKRIRRTILIILLALLCALAVLIGTVGVLYLCGRNALTGNGGGVSTPSSLAEEMDDDTVLYNGVRYRYNENVTAVLVIGVDKMDIQEDSTYGENGQADTIFLAVLDTKSGAMNFLPISREAMVDVNQYSADGSFTGVENTQLCLAYAYAANGEEGCLNVARSVSRLLYGVPINNYVAMDMDGIRALTNAVGGVTLTPTVTLLNWQGKQTITKGEKTTLTGNDALKYLRHRGTDAEANNQRMQRQKQFFTALLNSVGGKLQENIGRLPTYYKTISPYMVTNIDLSKTTYLAGCALTGTSWKNPTYLSISGKSVMGEKHAEFYADPASAYEAVLATFYTPVE